MKECEWLSDDFGEICCNPDCYDCADFCPYEKEKREKMCRKFKEKT